jgi:hypothetical protein
MDFVLISDDSYAVGLAVTLQSLLDSLSRTAPDSLTGRTARSVPAGASQATPAAPESSENLRVSAGEMGSVRVWLIDTGLSEHTWQQIQLMVDGAARNAVPGERVQLPCRSLKSLKLKAGSPQWVITSDHYQTLL